MTAKPKVIVYMDVDGVINSLSKDPDLGMVTGFNDYRKISVQGQHPLDAQPVSFPIRYSPTLVTILNELSALPGVQFKWLTTWLDQAPKSLCSAIGLHGEYWPVLTGYSRESDNAWGWWKFDAASADLARENPTHVYWIDDDLHFVDKAMKWVQASTTVTGICPKSAEGLRRDQVNALVLDIKQRL